MPNLKPLVTLKQLLLLCGLTLSTAPGFSAGEVLLNKHPYPQVEKALENFSFDASYLMWWFKAGPAPIPVATEGPLSTILSGYQIGSLGAPSTVILLGNQTLKTPMHQGGRFNLTYSPNTEHIQALEGSYFFLNKQIHKDTIARSFDINSAFSLDALFLTAPYNDPVFGPASYVIAGENGPGVATLSNYSSMQGAEFHLTQNIISSENKQFSWLAGFYFLQVKEGLSFATQSINVLPTDAFNFAGSFLNTVDDFSTQNNFYGGQIGANFNWSKGRFNLQSVIKVALGSVQQKLSVQGTTTTNAGTSTITGEVFPIPTTTLPGGFYAEPTNIGKQSQQHFAFIPEITLGGGFRLSKNITTFLNYNFLYVSHIVRPGNQMDGNINSFQVTALFGGAATPPLPLFSPATPVRLFNTSTFWAEGIQLGLRYQMA